MKHKDHMTALERAALSFLLAAAFCAGCLAAQGQDIRVQRVPPPPSAAAMWKHDLECSGIRPAPGTSLDSVVWLVGVWGPDPVDSSVTLGEWLPPDTIALLPLTYTSPVIVAHELMHHLLQGPDAEDVHPKAFYDCDLMPEQHPVDSVSQLVGAEPKPFRRAEPRRGREERIGDRNSCLDIFHCPAFDPWRRPTDPQFGPVWWLVSEAGKFGCPVTSEDFVAAMDHKPFFCEWRPWR